MTMLIEFLSKNTPPVRTILTVGPVFLTWAYACLVFAGYVKTVRPVRAGYTRKTFHVLTFAQW